MTLEKIDNIIEVILSEPIFLAEDGTLPAWSSQIWKSVAAKLNMNSKEGRAMTSDYLYTLVKNNRHDILKKIRSKLGFDNEIPDNMSSDLTSINSDQNENNSEHSSQNILPTKRKSCQSKKKIPSHCNQRLIRKN